MKYRGRKGDPVLGTGLLAPHDDSLKRSPKRGPFSVPSFGNQMLYFSRVGRGGDDVEVVELFEANRPTG